MGDSINPEFRAAIDAKLDSLIGRFYSDVPNSRHMMETRELNKEFYKRHTIETILRIRLRRVIDALVVHHFAKNDPRLAKQWAGYTEEEMLHDALFVKDLERLGVSREYIYSQEPFLATKLLQGYLYYVLENEGPLGVICYSYSIEYSSRKMQPQWISNLESLLGKEQLHGARTHVDYDVGEDHSQFVWNFLMSTAKMPTDEVRIYRHIETVFGLLCAYFQELSQATIAGQGHSAELVSRVPIAAVQAAGGLVASK